MSLVSFPFTSFNEEHGPNVNNILSVFLSTLPVPHDNMYVGLAVSPAEGRHLEAHFVGRLMITMQNSLLTEASSGRAVE